MGSSYCSVKKSLYMKEEWMTQADPPKEASAVVEMNVWLLLLSLNKMAH